MASDLVPSHRAERIFQVWGGSHLVESQRQHFRNYHGKPITSEPPVSWHFQKTFHYPFPRTLSQQHCNLWEPRLGLTQMNSHVFFQGLGALHQHLQPLRHFLQPCRPTLHPSHPTELRRVGQPLPTPIQVPGGQSPCAPLASSRRLHSGPPKTKSLTALRRASFYRQVSLEIRPLERREGFIWGLLFRCPLKKSLLPVFPLF